MSKSKIKTLPEFIESKNLYIETVHLLDIDNNKIGTFLQVNKKRTPGPRDTGLDVLMHGRNVKLFICKGNRVYMLSPEIDVLNSNNYEKPRLLLCEFTKADDGTPLVRFNVPGLESNPEQLVGVMKCIDWSDLTPFRKALLDHVLNNIHKTKWVYAIKSLITQTWT